MTEAGSKVVQVRHFGSPDGLDVVGAPLPTAGLGEVRVRILASGLECTSVVIRHQLHPQTMRRWPPFVPGYDVVGGNRSVRRWRPRLSAWRPGGRSGGTWVEPSLRPGDLMRPSTLASRAARRLLPALWQSCDIPRGDSPRKYPHQVSVPQQREYQAACDRRAGDREALAAALGGLSR